MESHSWSSEEEPLFLIENQMQDEKNDDFKYKQFWYNNVRSPSSQQVDWTPNSRMWKTPYRVKQGTTILPSLYFGSQTVEQKTKIDKIFKLSWDLINQKSNTKVLMLNCSKFEYMTDGTQTMNCSFTLPQDNDHCFHDK